MRGEDCIGKDIMCENVLAKLYELFILFIIQYEPNIYLQESQQSSPFTNYL